MNQGVINAQRLFWCHWRAYHMYLIWHVEGKATGEVMLSALRSSALHHVLECC
ncbi:hypothetical protein XF_1969 [Xylella fastidiosa 9a5c]|uniref:Uncharacterized protein n=1 Tax=Xylella fastidiosa (strain 9a5c) TaxID=160492 RepID=Q9PC16_XYLFA|nr:hypothetical protein XF_1969 [Xylella fastidiosa 9a5c]